MSNDIHKNGELFTLLGQQNNQEFWSDPWCPSFSFSELSCVFALFVFVHCLVPNVVYVSRFSIFCPFRFSNNVPSDNFLSPLFALIQAGTQRHSTLKQ